MVSQRPASCVSPLKRSSWVLVAVLAVAVLVAGLSVPASARYLDEKCPGFFGNRDVYRKVAWICEDCANLFRDSTIRINCSRNCFINEDFKTCVNATERVREMEQLVRWVSILGGGRR